MDLVEQFGARSMGQSDFIEHIERGGSGDLVIIDAPSSSTATGPELLIDTSIRQASRGRGAVACVTASNDCVAVATTRGWLLRYSWDEAGSERCSEVEVIPPKQQHDLRITALFMDPWANHVLVAVRSAAALLAGNAAGAAAAAAGEVYYVHRRWPRARALAEWRGLALTAVGWCCRLGDDSAPPPAAAGSTRGGTSVAGSVAGETCTGPLVLGTEAGALLEASLDERQKREAPPRVLIEGSKARRAAPPWTGLYQVPLPGGRRCLLAASHSHLRAWMAPPGLSWHAFFTSHAPSSTPPHSRHASSSSASAAAATASAAAASAAPAPPPVASLEAVAPSPHSQLQLYWPGGVGLGELPGRFAWLVGASVYHGELDWEACGGAGGGGGGGGAGGSGGELLSGVVCLPVPMEGAEGAEADYARSLVLTEWHLLLLAGDALRVVNRVSGRLAGGRAFASPLTRSVTGERAGEIDGLVRDPVSGSIYMAVDAALYEVTLAQEGRGMWRTYLELQDWDAALRCAAGPAQRDEVHRAVAEAAAAGGDYRSAALHWAKVSDGRPPFEDTALLLAGCGDPGALPVFLATRLQVLGGVAAARAAAAGASGGGAAGVSGGGAALGVAAPPPLPGPEAAQAVLAGAWLTELRLDAVNRALLETGGEASEAYQTATAALRSLLSEWVHVLDPGTTVSLLASYGRLEELAHYAACRGDHEGLCEQLLARPGQAGAARALAVLRSPAVPRELLYRFAPRLLAAAPDQAVDFFIAERPPLEPRRLVPALVRFGEPASPPAARGAVLRYVEFAMQQLGAEDSALHNLAVALYSLLPGAAGEARLLAYLTQQGRGRGGGLAADGSAPNGGGPWLYDTQYALRLAQECGKPRAAVRLMCQLGMYPDAVRAALALDLGLAQAVAAEPQGEDDGLRRKLWLQVARHVVEHGAGARGTGGAEGGGAADPAAAIRTAVDFLREAGGLLRIEDILPFFPDFVTIDNFQDAICDSLERYAAAIEALKGDMAEATAIAEALRADMQQLGSRSATLSLSQPCARCGGPIGEAPRGCSLPQGGALPPFYLFPTGCAYHTPCCAAEVTELVAPAQRKRIHTLMVRLSRCRPGAATAPAYGGAPAAEVSALREALAAEVACEDPRNGELAARLAEAPFMGEADRVEADSWAI